MLVLAGKAANVGDGKNKIAACLGDGSALRKFRDLVGAQGGDVRAIDDAGRLPRAPVVKTVKVSRSGYLARVDARVVGETSVQLGAGRERKDDPIDPAVGILALRKVGDRVREGDPAFEIHARDEASASMAAAILPESLKVTRRAVIPLPRFYRTIRS